MIRLLARSFAALRLPALPLLGLAALAGCGQDCDEPGTICTVMGIDYQGLAPEGAKASESALYWPSDVTAGPDGNPWILDWNNHRILTLPPDGEGDRTVEVVTGIVMVGDGPWPGPASTAAINHPTNIAFEPSGSFVFAAWHNSRVVRVDPAADTSDIVAGNGMRDFLGDEGPAKDAAFDLPSGVDVAADGTTYVADQANQRVRRIDPDGTIHTVAGNGNAAFEGDGGPATEACLNSDRSQNADPAGRVALGDGVLYIADTNNARIRAVDLDTGIIRTVVGSGEYGSAADGDPLATGMRTPRDVEVGPDGSLYYADTDNHCIRRVQDGVVETVAGVCGEAGFEGDNGPANEALLRTPFGFDVADDGTIWIADTFNSALRRVAP